MSSDPTAKPPLDRRSFAAVGLTALAGVSLSAGLAPAATTNVPNLYPNWNREQFQGILDHETSHRDFLLQQLGAAARPKPTFKNLLQPTVRAFAATARTIETTECGAYLGAAPAIFSRKYLAAAASIALIEGRHAGYLTTLFNQIHTTDVFNAEQDFEKPLTPEQVVQLTSPFVQDLNGGPPLTFSTTPSRANDIAILNFALFSEYLGGEFYGLNVPKFFGS